MTLHTRALGVVIGCEPGVSSCHHSVETQLWDLQTFVADADELAVLVLLWQRSVAILRHLEPISIQVHMLQRRCCPKSTFLTISSHSFFFAAKASLSRRPNGHRMFKNLSAICGFFA